MSIEQTRPLAINYYPCRYGSSRLVFRGPKRSLEVDYAAYLGGIETFGRFVPMPYPIELEFATGLKSVNLGCSNIGVDSYVNDRSLIDIARGAKVVVMEVIGAHNMSNRFYAVHPRRNDRFIRASNRLREAFPNVDFTDFTFTRHMLNTLREANVERFYDIAEELKTAWVHRMALLIREIDRPFILVWMAKHSPNKQSFDDEPLFVDRKMIEQLPGVHHFAEFVAKPDDLAAGMDELIFNDLEYPAALEMMGPITHRRVTAELTDIINTIK